MENVKGMQELAGAVVRLRSMHATSPITGAVYTPAGPTRPPSIPVAVSPGWVSGLAGSGASQRFASHGVAGLTAQELNVISDAIGHTNIRPAKVTSHLAAQDLATQQGVASAVSSTATDTAAPTQAVVQPHTVIMPLALSSTSASPANTQISPELVERLLGADARRRWESLGSRGLTLDERGRLSNLAGSSVPAARLDIPAASTIDEIILGAGEGLKAAAEVATSISDKAATKVLLGLAGIIVLVYMIQKGPK